MLVIVAERADAVAQALVARWASSEARLLTCTDLMQAGWRADSARPHDATAVVAGERVAAQRITGVLTRLTHVSPHELGEISGKLAESSDKSERA